MSSCVWCKQDPCELGDEDECEQRFVYALPPGPLCERCLHEPCPCCPLPWCDLMIPRTDYDDDDEPLPYERQPGETYFQVEPGDMLCCGGDCVVAADDFIEWHRDVDAVEAEQPEGYSVVVTAEGPFMPARVRRARRLASWYPPEVFEVSPKACSLIASVHLWQKHNGIVADGLIGPTTWAKADDDLRAIARELATELEAADLGFTQLGRFLMAADPPVFPDTRPRDVTGEAL